MNNLYVTGGRQRRRILKEEEDWNLYERALILCIDPETNTAETCVEYESPSAVCAADGPPSILFKAATLVEDKLYVPTSTEVLIFKVPEFKRVGYVSLPCFNDLHHVRPTPDGNLLVVSTGLDMVVESTLEGKVLRQWNVRGREPWARFSPTTDYRRISTTKPHESHPNFVFQIRNDVWVTRCHDKDAVCLTRQGLRIPLGSECVHDGHFYGNMIYFTQVDGHLIIVERDTLRTVEVIDLKTIDNDDKALLGWCRGVLAVEDRRVWVGFTRVRRTKFKEQINWVKHAFHDVQKPAHIALYDIAARRCVQEINLEPFGMNIVYSIFPAPRF